MLRRTRNCNKCAQPVPKAVYRSSCRDKHNRPRCDSNLGPVTPQSGALATRLLRQEASKRDGGWIVRGVPTSGRTSDVAGMFSATSIRKTVIDSSVVMPIVTFSPGHHGDRRRHPIIIIIIMTFSPYPLCHPVVNVESNQI